jgi:D-aminoacyl-tRNA deacylase
MRAVVQRVSEARVTVDGEVVGAIGAGLCVLLGVAEDDTLEDVAYTANKVVGLRIFEDDEGKMNRSLAEQGSELYEAFCEKVREQGIEVATGRFRAMMEVSLVNQGPVTLLIDSRKTF